MERRHEASTALARGRLAMIGLAFLAGAPLAAALPAAAQAPGAQAPGARACRPGLPATPNQTEGPFYKAGAPQRADLTEPGKAEPSVEIVGRVLDRQCRPVAGATLDVWQADASGRYDNAGFRMRGRFTADREGRYRLRTVMPGGYQGRARHIHVKVGAPGGRDVTTQLYFPGEPGNRRDGLFRQELVIKTAKSGDALSGEFDFILDTR